MAKVYRKDRDMSYKILVSEDKKYIITKHWGEITSEMIMKRTIEAHALGKKYGITRHLMDVTEAKNVEPVIKTYEFAYRDVLETPGFDLNVRVAVLITPGDHSHNFAETVARNAGQDITIFSDREAAIKHLLYESN
jgi:hypothetical protein